MANSYLVLGQPEEGLRLWVQALALRKAKLGPDHPDTLRSMAGVATAYVALGRHSDAAALTRSLWESESQARRRSPRHALEYAGPGRHPGRTGPSCRGPQAPRADPGAAESEARPRPC